MRLICIWNYITISLSLSMAAGHFSAASLFLCNSRGCQEAIMDGAFKDGIRYHPGGPATDAAAIYGKEPNRDMGIPGQNPKGRSLRVSAFWRFSCSFLAEALDPCNQRVMVHILRHIPAHLISDRAVLFHDGHAAYVLLLPQG